MNTGSFNVVCCPSITRARKNAADTSRNDVHAAQDDRFMGNERNMRCTVALFRRLRCSTRAMADEYDMSDMHRVHQMIALNPNMNSTYTEYKRKNMRSTLARSYVVDNIMSEHEVSDVCSSLCVRSTTFSIYRPPKDRSTIGPPLIDQHSGQQCTAA